jgi:hypothetical protein
MILPSWVHCSVLFLTTFQVTVTPGPDPVSHSTVLDDYLNLNLPVNRILVVVETRAVTAWQAAGYNSMMPVHCQCASERPPTRSQPLVLVGVRVRLTRTLGRPGLTRTMIMMSRRLGGPRAIQVSGRKIRVHAT